MFDLDKAPKEVSDATIATNRAFKRYRKAVDQIELWNAERDIAASEHTSASKRHQDILTRWDPNTNIVSPGPEEFPTT